jgi:hypothetical protein
MLKFVLAIGVATAALAFIPAQAGTVSAPSTNTNTAPSSGAAAAATNYECTDTSMKEIRAEGDKIVDATKKAAFLKEMQMAGDSMAGKDAAGCADHMKNLTNMYSQ